MVQLHKIDLDRDALGRSIGGGIPMNSLVLVEGRDGAGKSIFAQRLVYGLLTQNTTVTYLSTELNTMGFVEQMASLDYNVTDHILFEKLLFLPMFPYLGEMKLSKNFVKNLMAAKEIFAKDVIVFDTFSFLLMQNDLDMESNLQLIKFLKKLNSMGKTIIFCVDTDHIDTKFTTIMRSISDLTFRVEVKTFAGEPIKVIFIDRFKRPGDKTMSAVPFKVEPGKGFAIEIASFS
ncbi:MAG: ATPase domain-containing protein [Candidatus Woesearchaeota archaeon]